MLPENESSRIAWGCAPDHSAAPVAVPDGVEAKHRQEEGDWKASKPHQHDPQHPTPRCDLERAPRAL